MVQQPRTHRPSDSPHRTTAQTKTRRLPTKRQAQSAEVHRSRASREGRIIRPEFLIWVVGFARPDGTCSDSCLHEQEDKDAEGDQGGYQESSPPPVGGHALGEVSRCQSLGLLCECGMDPVKPQDLVVVPSRNPEHATHHRSRHKCDAVQSASASAITSAMNS